MRTHLSIRLAFSALLSIVPALPAQVWQAGYQLLTAPLPGGPLEVPAPGAFGDALAAGDFDGDGFADLAVGEPEASDTQGNEVGRVLIYFGSSSGLATEPGWVGEGGIGSDYGAVLAAGDFDDDGTDELAIGIPGFSVHVPNGGRVELVQRLGDSFVFQSFDQGVNESESVEGGDRFGASLAVGDWNGDGVDDLAIGAPGESLEPSGDEQAGAVIVAFGVAAAAPGAARGQLPLPFDFLGSELLHEDVTGVDGVAEDGDRFGSALAAADLDCDGIDELAVGTPAEDLAATLDVGAVTIFTGSPDGLYTLQGALVGSVHLLQSDFGGDPEQDDRFGAALAGGRFVLDLGACDELAIGAPEEDVNAEVDAGTIHIYRSGPPALTDSWTQTTVGALAESSDYFGAALVAGDFDGRSGEELAIGAPIEEVGGDVQVGQVSVVPTSGGSLAPASSAQFWPRPGLDSPALDGEYQFGGALAAGDFDGNGSDDLAIGAPNATVDDGTGGAVFVLYSALFAADFETGDQGEWPAAQP